MWLWMVMPFVLLKLLAEKSPATKLLVPLGRGISPLRCAAVEMTVRWSGSCVIFAFFHSPLAFLSESRYTPSPVVLPYPRKGGSGTSPCTAEDTKASPVTLTL